MLLKRVIIVLLNYSTATELITLSVMPVSVYNFHEIDILMELF